MTLYSSVKHTQSSALHIQVQCATQYALYRSDSNMIDPPLERSRAVPSFGALMNIDFCQIGSQDCDVHDSNASCRFWHLALHMRRNTKLDHTHSWSDQPVAITSHVELPGLMLECTCRKLLAESCTTSQPSKHDKHSCMKRKKKTRKLSQVASLRMQSLALPSTVDQCTGLPCK